LNEESLTADPSCVTAVNSGAFDPSRGQAGSVAFAEAGFVVVAGFFAEAFFTAEFFTADFFPVAAGLVDRFAATGLVAGFFLAMTGGLRGT
jgi:hypothetical protein